MITPTPHSETRKTQSNEYGWKIPPWFWLVALFLLPLLAWVAVAVAAIRANIKQLDLPPRVPPAQVERATPN